MAENSTPPDDISPLQETVPLEKQLQVAIVAHNADTLVLVARANDSNADEVEIDVNTSLEPTPILGKAVAYGRHGLPVPFQEYDTAEALVSHISPHKKVVLDLKVHPELPFEDDRAERLLEHIDYLLPLFREQGRLNMAITGGNEEMMDALSKKYPELELRWTVWSVEDYERLKKHGDQIQSMSVRAATLKKLGMEAFKGKQVYAFHIPPGEEDAFRKMGVAGIVTDWYKNYIIDPLTGQPLETM